MTQAGNLRERITLQALSSTQNAAGEPIKSWSTGDTVWAAVRPVRGRELFDADRFVGLRPVEFTARFSTTVDNYDEKDRIVWRSRNYSIDTKVHIDARRREIEFLATLTT